METRSQGNWPSLRGIHLIDLVATAIGIGVIILLNLATPLEYLPGRLSAPDQKWYRQRHHILNLPFF